MKETNNKNKRKIGIAAGCITAAILLILGIFLYLYRVQLGTDYVCLELGETASVDPFTYLDGYDFAVERSRVDDSGVDYQKTGQYLMTVTHFYQSFEVVVRIKDTISPELVLTEDRIVIQPGDTISIEDFVVSTYDISGDVETYFEQQYAFDKVGTYPVKIWAVDQNENESFGIKDIIVDVPPVFGEQKEYYLAVGQEPDFMEYIQAIDDVDGDVTDQIILDSSEFCPDEPGEYLISYEVTDQYGLTATTQNLIHVYTALELQNLLNEQVIDWRNESQIVLGALNPYDAGIFKADTIENTSELMNPYIVCIYKSRANGGWSKGSGFIISMDEEQIVICTNAHVAGSDKFKEVHFMDNVVATGEVVYKDKGNGTYNDVSFITVNCVDLPDELLEKLRTVHINLGYYTALSNTEKIDVTFRSMNENGEIWFDSTGVLQEKNHIYSIDNPDGSKYGVMLMASIKLKHGVSGSALIDKSGNLLGMATSNYGSENCFVRLTVILDDFEKYFGYRIEYQ